MKEEAPEVGNILLVPFRRDVVMHEKVEQECSFGCFCNGNESARLAIDGELKELISRHRRIAPKKVFLK
jgi:hypothetical protein